MNTWFKGITVLGILATLLFIGTRIYNAGYQSATLKYEQRINKQDTELKQQKQALEHNVYAVEQQAIKQIDQVQTVYVPVEKEIIKYVSTQLSSQCDNDFSEWVRIHNAAATPYNNQTAGHVDEGTTAAGTN